MLEVMITATCDRCRVSKERPYKGERVRPADWLHLTITTMKDVEGIFTESRFEGYRHLCPHCAEDLSQFLWTTPNRKDGDA